LDKTTVALLLAYDGGAFRGWQRQPGQASVQQALERALEQHLGRRLAVFGASRTDAGVHAEGQVAHFTARLPIDVPALAAALPLPPSIRLRAAAVAKASFHARSSAVAKRYRYRFSWGDGPRDAFFLGAGASPRWDPAHAALRGLDGLPQLSGLASPSRGRKPAPPLTSWSLEAGRDAATLEVRAPAFRKHQIRNLAGHLAAVALGLAAPETLAALARMRRPWRGAMAPAHGLTLLEVLYPAELDPFR